MADPRSRALKHISRLAESGTDTRKFVEALGSIRDDDQLTCGERDAILRTLAQNAAAQYAVIVTAEPLASLNKVLPNAGSVSTS